MSTIAPAVLLAKKTPPPEAVAEAKGISIAKDLVRLEGLSKPKGPSPALKLRTSLATGYPGGPPNMGGRTRRRFKNKRLMSRKYCKKTPCRRMGFTQKASCRPYKNCYTRRK